METLLTITSFLKDCHHIDKTVTLAINSLNCQFSDFIWQIFSNKEIWYLLYLAVLIFLFRNLGWKKAVIVTLAIILTIVCCDQMANFTKFHFQRLRPCWDLEMTARGLHTLEDFGGKYGFFSAHAANAMGFAVCSIAGFKNDPAHRYRIYGRCIPVWAFLVGISRVFVGKHFFGDVMTGFCVGLVIGTAFGKLASFIISKTVK